MKIIRAGVTIEDAVDGEEILRKIERAGRTCYKSEAKITGDSARVFVASIIKRGHESVLEHEKVTVRIVCDRGVTHEIVRHRIASYSQESTRYCNYGHENEITVILPLWYVESHQQFEAIFAQSGYTPDIFEVFDTDLTDLQRRYWMWRHSCAEAQEAYLDMLKHGALPQEARYVLPNSLKTELIMTCNFREWRHIFDLRCSRAAHPQMRELLFPLLDELHEKIPVVFDDLFGKYAADLQKWPRRAGD
jgi:thymidylate synthase (FAD)